MDTEKLMYNTAEDFDTAISICGGGATTIAELGYCDQADLDFGAPTFVDAKKGYDNLLAISNYEQGKIYMLDNENGVVYCIEDDYSGPWGICLNDFTGIWNYPGASNGDRLSVDISFNASKIQNLFYANERRFLLSEHTDTQLENTEFVLADRFTVDGSVLSGAPNFYVYGYDLETDTHNFKLELLESVE